MMVGVEGSAATTTNESAPEGTGGPPPAEGSGTAESTSREAARYRTRLRQVEAERDRLQGTLDAIQTAEVERIARGAGLSVAGDVWSFGASLDTLRGADGSIDQANVEGTVQAILKDRPGLKAAVVGDLGAGRGGAASDVRRQEHVGLSQLFEGRLQR
jgi:hypothetical protein